ncbi:MAG: arylsulfatase [Verrucomicrobiae bacterium]|nr:arylsulfatase [Verrucomicrobiae bacterium]
MKLSLLLLSLALVTGLRAAPFPNIVYILADDFGYGDASCYNPESKIPTPFIDRLAAQGMRFTDAHSPSAVCTPTRYGILTGRYCWRTRLKYRVLDGFDPPLIDRDTMTVPTLLKDRGYRTACIGKWHLGMQFTDNDGAPMPAVPLDRREPPRAGKNVDYSRRISDGPTERGFDSFFGISASLNMAPFCFLENDRPVIIPTIDHPSVRTEFITVDEGLRSPDFTITGVMPALAGRAVRYIENHGARHRDQAFFLYLPLSAPHLPVVPNAEFRSRSHAGDYGDFVVETDAFVGDVMNALDRAGLAENTLLIFTSDNGGLYHWWDAREADDLKNYRPSARGQQMKEFGHQGNAHLRGTKADIWEGGHRVPFVARWPGKTPAGSTCDALVELTDLFATCAAITHSPAIPNAGKDSRNILPLLLGNTPKTPIRDYAVHHSLWGVFAIRQGDWKLIPHRGSGGFSRPRDLDPAKIGGPPGQLYNLKVDPSETTNVWADHPEVVARLSKLLAAVQAH